MFAVRLPVPADAPELSAVATQTFHDGWAAVVGSDAAREYAAHYLTPERLASEIADTDAHYFALATDTETGAIIGYGKLDLRRAAHESVTGERPVLLQRLYVAESGRGAGVADALLAALEAEAKRRDFATLWLECDPANARAWRFYEKRGFVARGVAPYQLPNGQNDAVRVMEQPLPQYIAYRKTECQAGSFGATRQI